MYSHDCIIAGIGMEGDEEYHSLSTATSDAAVGKKKALMLLHLLEIGLVLSCTNSRPSGYAGKPPRHTQVAIGDHAG